MPDAHSPRTLRSVLSRFSMFVFPNQYACRRRKHIAGNIQILRRRFVLEYAPSEIVRRTVTGAEKATWPVVRKVRLWTFLKTRSRCAAEMGADAYDDENVLTISSGPILVVAVGWQWHRKRMLC